MPTVLIVPLMMREVRAPYVDLLEAAGFDVRYPKNPQLAQGTLDTQEAINELQIADATLASVEHYSAEVLRHMPRLRVIARCGVGYDRVDVPAATERGVITTVTPNANHEAVAELALALLFATTKSILINDRQVRQGRWVRNPPLPIRGRTLGILGLGRIGRSLSRRAVAMGLKVLATETYPDQQFVSQMGIELVGLDALLNRSDFLSIHCPLNDDTRGLIDHSALNKMKPGSVLINTARGGIVVESDLCSALRSGHLAAAGIDVFEQEPPQPDNSLFQMEQVVVTPHLAGIDQASIEAMGIEAAECICSLYAGDWPEGAVINEQLRSSWTWDRS